MKRLWLLAGLAMAAVALALELPGQTVPMPTPPVTYLFVVDTSFSMRHLLDPARQAVFDLVFNGAQGQMQAGDVYSIWTFNEQVQSDGYPSQSWDPLLSRALAFSATRWLKQKTCENTSNNGNAILAISRAAINMPNLVAMIINDGDDPLQGTAFDREINRVYQQRGRALRSAHKPMITTLVFRNAKNVQWSVLAVGEPIPFDGLLDQARPTVPLKPVTDLTPLAAMPTERATPMAELKPQLPVPPPVAATRDTNAVARIAVITNATATDPGTIAPRTSSTNPPTLAVASSTAAIKPTMETKPAVSFAPAPIAPPPAVKTTLVPETRPVPPPQPNPASAPRDAAVTAPPPVQIPRPAIPSISNASVARPPPVPVPVSPKSVVSNTPPLEAHVVAENAAPAPASVHETSLTNELQPEAGLVVPVATTASSSWLFWGILAICSGAVVWIFLLLRKRQIARTPSLISQTIDHIDRFR